MGHKFTHKHTHETHRRGIPPRRALNLQARPDAYPSDPTPSRLHDAHKHASWGTTASPRCRCRSAAAHGSAFRRSHPPHVCASRRIPMHRTLKTSIPSLASPGPALASQAKGKTYPSFPRAGKISPTVPLSVPPTTFQRRCRRRPLPFAPARLAGPEPSLEPAPTPERRPRGFTESPGSRQTHTPHHITKKTKKQKKNKNSERGRPKNEAGRRRQMTAQPWSA